VKLSIQEHIKTYNDCPDYLESLADSERVVDVGMLSFDEKTAHNWHGPFKGGYAFYSIQDYTGYADLCTIEQMNQKEDDFYAKHDPKDERKGYNWYKETTTVEFPVRLYMCGNDDCSYSKYFKTFKEAQDLLASFDTKAVLNFYRDIRDNGFVFTN
jgi:hypothetical protein